MVLEMERRWCAYVDGERVAQTFPSRSHAETTVRRIVNALPAPVVRVVAPGAPQLSRRKHGFVGAAIAVCVLLLGVVGVTMILHRDADSHTETTVMAADIRTTKPIAAADMFVQPEPGTEHAPTDVHPDVWDHVALPLLPTAKHVSKHRLRPRRFKRPRRYRRTRARRRVKSSNVWGRDIQMPYRD